MWGIVSVLLAIGLMAAACERASVGDTVSDAYPNSDAHADRDTNRDADTGHRS